MSSFEDRLHSLYDYKLFHVHLALIMLEAVHDFAHLISCVVRRPRLFVFTVLSHEERQRKRKKNSPTTFCLWL